MNDAFTRCRGEYIEALKTSDAKMVFLCLRRSFDPQTLMDDFRDMAQNILFLEEQGFIAGCWLQSFGFGNPVTYGEEKFARFTKITGVDGAVCGDAFCPLDADFTAFEEDLVQQAALAGAKIIMLDDDLCLNIRPGIGCACDRHLSLFEKRVGHPVSRDQLRDCIYSAKPGPERRAWLDLMGETLADFCAKMRQAVDEINPTIRLGLCAGYTSWDMEGIDAISLSRILAGNTRPFLRLSGAPYWAEMRRFPGQSMAHIIEFTRMQQAWCEEADIDYFSENDSFPRPRYRIPAAYLETFDFCMTAAGCDRQLKYLLDYFSRPEYEQGYLRAHLRNRKTIRAVGEAFDDLMAVGIYVHEDMRKLSKMTLPEGASDKQIMRAASFSAAADLLSGLGIPTTYDRGENAVTATFGDGGRTVPLESRGYILDCTAALAMEARGVDTGLHFAERLEFAPAYEFFIAENDRVELNWLDITENSEFYRAALKDGAKVQSMFKGNGSDCPASYVYVNASGVAFLVLLFRADTVLAGGSLMRSYYRQAQLFDAIASMGAPSPVELRNVPGCYVLCRGGNGRLGVALCNFSLDWIERPQMALTQAWTKAEFICGSGELSEGKLTLNSIPPYGFAAVVLSEQ